MRNLTFLVIAILLSTCSKEPYVMDEFYKLYGDGTDDVGALIEKTSEKKIYFGHQSVGYNIIQGIERWEEYSGVSLEKEEVEGISNESSVPFVHFRVGRNGDPEYKIRDFATNVNRIPEHSTAIAFFKLCYVDIEGSTDPEALFENFKSEIKKLRESRADIEIVLFTIPLTTIQKGPKAIIKRLLNRKPSGILENVRRHQFNELLRAEYQGHLPIFDLAKLESTLPDGSPVSYSYNGKTYPCMSEVFTYDSGHLNEIGARQVAYNLLAFLAQEI